MLVSVEHYKYLPILQSISNINIPCTFTLGNHRDIERVCEDCWLFIEEQPNPWIQHECDVKGCKEGYITVDGNCKLHRAICAAQSDMLQLENLPKIPHGSFHAK